MKNQTKLTPTQIKLKKVLKPIIESILQENSDGTKYIIKRGGQIAGYTSNGNHYVIVRDNVWELYAETGTKLATGKITHAVDLDYIKKLSN